METPTMMVFTEVNPDIVAKDYIKWMSNEIGHFYVNLTYQCAAIVFNANTPTTPPTAQYAIKATNDVLYFYTNNRWTRLPDAIQHAYRDLLAEKVLLSDKEDLEK